VNIEMRGEVVPDPNAKPDHDMPEVWRSGDGPLNETDQRIIDSFTEKSTP
jgi:hypothetical protein